MGFDSRQLRDALGRFATGVCVVTAIDEEMGPIGMTVNSFSALSLEPPLVLWSIQKDSERFAIFNDTTGFGLSILSEEQSALSNRYAQKQNYHLEAGSFRIGRGGQAILRDCMCSFECRLWERVEGGDHIIQIGEVIDIHQRPHGRPLLFYGGQYRQIR